MHYVYTIISGGPPFGTDPTKVLSSHRLFIVAGPSGAYGRLAARLAISMTVSQALTSDGMGKYS